jgi:hypothetical protein
MGYTSYGMNQETEFEVRELAHLVNTNSRRVEGWVEKGFLTPAMRGRGPGRRRVFDLVNVIHAALLTELLRTFGERSPVAGPIVRAVARTLRDDLRRLVMRLAPLRPGKWDVIEAAASAGLSGLSTEVLWIVLEGKRGVSIRLVKPDQIPEAARDVLGEGHTVVLLSLTPVLAKLGRRLGTLRR